MSKDKLKSKVEQVSGTVKESVGKVTGNKKLQAEGTVEKVAGKAKEVVSDAKDTLKDAVKKIKK